MVARRGPHLTVDRLFQSAQGPDARRHLTPPLCGCALPSGEIQVTVRLNARVRSGLVACQPLIGAALPDRASLDPPDPARPGRFGFDRRHRARRGRGRITPSPSPRWDTRPRYEAATTSSWATASGAAQWHPFAPDPPPPAAPKKYNRHARLTRFTAPRSFGGSGGGPSWWHRCVQASAPPTTWVIEGVSAWTPLKPGVPASS